MKIANFVQNRLKVSPEGKPVLVGMKCNNCGETMFPKEKLCPNCSSEDVEEVTLSNRGKVWFYTIVYEGLRQFSRIDSALCCRFHRVVCNSALTGGLWISF